jgi:hypothetical protein
MGHRHSRDSILETEIVEEGHSIYVEGKALVVVVGDIVNIGDIIRIDGGLKSVWP